MYKIWIRQPWNTQGWERWNPAQSYIFKWSAMNKLAELQKSPWWTEKTEWYVGRNLP